MPFDLGRDVVASMTRKHPFLGICVDVVVVAIIGWGLGTLGASTRGGEPFGLLVQLTFGASIFGLALAHEFTGGPRAASWPALVSGVLVFVTLVTFICVGMAACVHASFGAALAFNAPHFLWPFLLWIVLVEGGVAWKLLRGEISQEPET